MEVKIIVSVASEDGTLLDQVTVVADDIKAATADIVRLIQNNFPTDD